MKGTLVAEEIHIYLNIFMFISCESSFCLNWNPDNPFHIQNLHTMCISTIVHLSTILTAVFASEVVATPAPVSTTQAAKTRFSSFPLGRDFCPDTSSFSPFKSCSPSKYKELTHVAFVCFLMKSLSFCRLNNGPSVTAMTKLLPLIWTGPATTWCTSCRVLYVTKQWLKQWLKQFCFILSTWH